VVPARGAQVVERNHDAGAIKVDGSADALGELVSEFGQTCRHGGGQGGDLGIAEADRVVLAHAREHRRPPGVGGNTESAVTMSRRPWTPPSGESRMETAPFPPGVPRRSTMTNLALNLINAVAWGALGHATAAYEIAAAYAAQRTQFGKPLVSYEGTETIQTLIVGKDITGVSAIT